MNITIEFPDLLLADIIERTIKRYLHESSEGYEFLQLYVQRQLKDEISRQVELIDLEAEVRSFLEPSLDRIIEESVEKALDRRVKVVANRVLSQQE